MSPEKLILWDIDGTLAQTSHSGTRSMIRTMRELYGITTDLSEVDIRGRTDWNIFNLLCSYHRLEDTPETMKAYFDHYFTVLADEITKGKVYPFPGVAEILATIASTPGYLQGLLTGNMPRGAEIKLTAAGIWKFFPFGAFGSDNADRNLLASIALKRAEQKAGVTFDMQNVFVIGDTPHDIDCARFIRARAIAVATGGHTMDALKQCKPDFIFQDLGNMKAFLDVIGIHPADKK